MQNYSHVEIVLKELAVVQSSLSESKGQSSMKSVVNTFIIFKAILEFYSWMNSNRMSNPLAIPRVEIGKLFVHSSSIKQGSFHISFIGFLIKMINLRVFKEVQLINIQPQTEILEDIITYFVSIKDKQKEPFQLKLQQSIMNLMQEELIHFGNYTFVEKVPCLDNQSKCFTIVLSVRNFKQPIIQSAADQTLLRLVELFSLSTQRIITKNVPQEESKQIEVEKQGDSQHSQMRNLVKFISDLILICDSKKPIWYPSTVGVDRSFGLSTLTTFVKEMGQIFLCFRDIETILKVDLVNFRDFIQSHNQVSLIKIFQTVIDTFKCMVAQIEIGPLIFREYWEIFFKYIKSKEQNILKCLSYQSFLICVDKSIFIQCLISSQDKKDFYSQIIQFLSDVAINSSSPSEIEWKKWETFENTISLDDCQISDQSLILRFISEFLIRFILSLCMHAESKKLDLKVRIKIDKNGELKDFLSAIESTWEVNLKAIKSLLQKEIDEKSLQNILNTIVQYVNLSGRIINFIIILGCLKLNQIQEHFLQLICGYCLPKTTKQHLQINKMVLNMCICLGSIPITKIMILDILELNSWIIIFQTFQDFETIFNQDQNNSTIQDVQILLVNITQIFSQSGQYDVFYVNIPFLQDDHFSIMMDALNQMTLESLQNNFLEQQKQYSNQHIKLFSLSKLGELVKYNLHRLDIFWELIIAHFFCVVSSKNTHIIQHAADVLSQIVLMAFEHLADYHKEEKKNFSHFIKDKWATNSYQRTLFQPLVDISELKSIEVKEILLQSVIKLLQNDGHEIIKSGWDQILQLLFEISGEQHNNHVKKGLVCLDYIINHFLNLLNGSHYIQMIDIIENFMENSGEPGVNAQISNQLWLLGDYLSKIHFENDTLYLRIFFKLSQIFFDQSTEIRNSAIQFFTSILLQTEKKQFIGNYNYSVWKKIFDQFFDVLQKVFLHYQSKSSGNESDHTQWEQTFKLLMQKTTLLMKKYYSWFNAEEAIQALLPLITQIIKQGSPQIFIEGIQMFKELFLIRTEEHFQESVQLQELLECIEKLFATSRGEALKAIAENAIPDMLQLLAVAFKQDRLTGLFFLIYEKILHFPLFVEYVSNVKIAYDDTPTFQLLEEIQTYQKLNDYFLQMTNRVFAVQMNSRVQVRLVRRYIEKINILTIEVLPNLIKHLRCNIDYLNFHYVEEEGNSIWYQASEQLLKLPFDQRIQSLVPTSLQYASLMASQHESVRASVIDNIKMQEKYLSVLNSHYLNEEEVLSDDFRQYVGTLYELAIMSHDMIPSSAITSFGLLCAKPNTCSIVLPYYIQAAEHILTDQKNPKIMIKLLETLSEIKIPEKMFLNFIPLKRDDILQVQENSILQTTIGHVGYLMPLLTKCISNSNFEVRKIVQVLIAKIANSIHS